MAKKGGNVILEEIHGLKKIKLLRLSVIGKVTMQIKYSFCLIDICCGIIKSLFTKKCLLI